jgi:hypothetical protein
MTAAENLLVELGRRGFSLAADGAAIRCSPASRLTDADRRAVRQHKAELLTLIVAAQQSAQAAQPADAPGDAWEHPLDRWEQAAADDLARHALARLDSAGWPAGAALGRELGKHMDAIDRAYLARFMPDLRQSIDAFHKTLDGAARPATGADDDAAVCRAIEQSEGLPPGSVFLYRCHGDSK